MESTVNTFTKGLNRDVSPTKYSPENYYDALNVRLITDETLNAFSLTNEKGNVLTFRIPATQAVYKIDVTDVKGIYSIQLYINNQGGGFNPGTVGTEWTAEILYNKIIAYPAFASAILNDHYKVYNKGTYVLIVGIDNLTQCSTTGSFTTTRLVEPITNHYVINGIQLRDYLILFTTGNTGDGQIWKLEIEEGGTVKDIGASNYLVPSVHLSYNGDLNFSTSHRIEAYSNYETSEIGKVYFTDNNNNFRHFNVLDPDSLSIPLSAIDIIPEVSFGLMTIEEVLSSGTYTSGMVQYAHQYYNLHGSQSTFSPSTGLIHLTKSSETLSDTRLYLGTATDLPTGKAVRLSITGLDQSFTNVRVVAIHYKTFNGTPTITVVEDREIPSSGTIYLTDGGNIVKGTLSDLEFSALGSVNFKCKSFDIKDNILFPANITEEFYDVDETTYWDSRAYRWNKPLSGTPSAVLESSDGTTLTLTSVNDTVPEEHDCIQTKQSQWEHFRYTCNGFQRYGGEGKNIKYYFNVTSVVEDSYASDTTKAYADLENGSYPNYANPLVHANQETYFRDEVYRFAIVFKDVNGRKSFAKWIADIKMPAVYETDTNGASFKSFVKVGTDVKINILSLTFEVSNIPSTAESFEIVRVKREDADKTILAQGILAPTISASSVYYPNYQPLNSTTLSTAKLFNFLSPEVNFLKKTFSEGKLLVIAGTLGPANGTQTHQIRAKIHTQVPRTDMSALSLTPTEIIESRIIAPSYDATYTINNNTYKNYRVAASTNYGYMCTNLVVGTNSIVQKGNTTGYAITNIVRTLSNQYGGNSYTARLGNKYIYCNQTYTGDMTTTVVSTVHGGDTFIGYFDLLYGYFDTTESSTAITVDFLFPVETSINLSLRHDYCFTKQDSAQDYNKYLMTEVAGIHSDDTDTEHFTQQTDLYLYNQVYSRENDVISYFSKPLNFSNNKTFDARILSSELKKTNEEIDSWTTFLATNYVDVDATYGPINKLITFGKRIYFFQDKAFGWASVNERSLITPDASGSTLSLGKGGILDQYFYVSRHSGSKHQFSVIHSPNGLYYYDAANNRLNVFTGEQNEPLSELKGFSSYLKSMGNTGIRRTDTTLLGLGVHGIYDQRFNRILWTFNDFGNANEFTIGYNELAQCFESFYSFKPQIYFKFDESIYSMNHLDLSKGYLHNSGTYGMFYNELYDAEISVLVNKDPYRAKAFTNVEYLLNTTPESSQGFETIQVTNHYQDTGVVILDSSNSNRRARVYRLTIPRNNKDGDTSSRIISEYAIVKLLFGNQRVIATKFELPHLITHYFSKPM